MKNSLLAFIVIAFFSFTACGQKSNDVPEKVSTSFSKKFPNATKIKWDKENENEWEAEFKMDGEEFTASFDNSGVWMESEYEIGMKDVPEVVKATLDNEFAGYKISEAEVSETADAKVFEFMLKKDGEKKEVAIDAEGNLVVKKQTKEEEEDEEGEEDDD